MCLDQSFVNVTKTCVSLYWLCEQWFILFYLLVIVLRDHLHCLDKCWWLMRNKSGWLVLFSIEALSSHSDGQSGVSECSWASLKSALLLLGGIHRNSVNFDNPLLSAPHCQPQSVMGGVWGKERRVIFRATERQRNKKENIPRLISCPVVSVVWLRSFILLSSCLSCFMSK